MAAPISELLYRLKIEGAEAFEARLAQLGETERREIERTLQAAARKHDRADNLEQQSNAVREQANRGIARTRAVIEGNLPAYEAEARAARNAAAAGGALAATQGKVAVSSGQLRAGAQQLSFQISDVAQQFALGTPPMVIFAQQGAQVITAVQMMTGATGGLLGFLAGPWGAVLTGAAVVAGTFTASLFKGNETIDQQIVKLRESAAQTEQTERAKAAFANSIDGVTVALREQRKALDDSANAERSAAERALLQANAQLQLSVRTREATLEKLKQAKADAEALAFGAQGNPAEAAGEIVARQRVIALVKQLEKQIARLEANIGESGRQVIQNGLRVLDERAQETGIQRLDRLHREAAARRRAELDEQIRRRQISARDAERELNTLRQQQRVERERAQQAEQARDRAAAAAQRAANDTRLVQLGLPVDGRITSGVGARRAPTAGASTNHAGIDIAAAAGTAVRAPTPGIVLHAGRMGGYGNVVVVDYGGGTIAKFAHLSEILTKQGERVGAGELLGRVGSTGTATGPHLHYEVRTNGRVVDPRGRIRVGDPARGEAVNAAQAAREAAAADRERAQEIERLTRQYDPLTAATAKYREELAAIERLFPAGEQRDRMTAAVQRDYHTRRAGMLGEAIGIAGIARDADGEAARTAAFDREIERYSEGVRLAEIEIGLVGRSARERDAILSRIDRENALKREGRDLSDAQVQQILAAGDAYDQARQRLDALNDNWREGVRIGEQLVDNVLDPRNWDNWGEAGKRILEDLLLDMLRLAAINPLKNALFGSGLPTLGGVFGGLFGGGGGASGAAGVGAGLSSIRLPGLATGTASASAGMYLLGENGPEIGIVPGGARVMSSSQTRQALAGSAVPVIVNQTLNVTGGVDLASRSEVQQLAVATYQAAKDGAIEAMREAQRRAV